MPGAISGLGAFAGGLDDTLGPQLQQYKQDQAIGQGIYALAGVPAPQQQSPLGSLGSGIQSLLGGGGAASNTPALPPAAGQGGVAQSPISGLSPGQPMNPSGGQVAPVGLSQPAAAGVQTAAAQQPTSQPQQTAQLSPQVQQQQQAPKAPDLSAHNGMYDFPTMIRALTARGMPPAQLGRVVRSPAFEGMMNQIGLQQYRALMGGLGIDREQEKWANLERLTEEGRRRDERLTQSHRLDAMGRSLDREESAARTAYTTQSNQLIYSGLPPEKQQQAIKDLNDQFKNTMNDLDKRRAELDKQYDSEPAGDSAGDETAQSIANAKQAIQLNPSARAQIIQKLKSEHPDADVSGL